MAFNSNVGRQKEFVEKLCDLKNAIPIHIFLVVHPKKGRDEEEIPGKMDVAGSGGITNLADNLITIWRNKSRELAVRSQKQRKDTDPSFDDKLNIARNAKSPDKDQKIILAEDNTINGSVGVLAWLQKDRANGNEQKFGLEYQNHQHVPAKSKNNRHYVTYKD